MAPPPTLQHLSILNKEFYENLNFFGRDKLFNLLRDKYGEVVLLSLCSLCFCLDTAAAVEFEAMD